MRPILRSCLRRGAPDAGFTLIEVLVAIFVLVVGALSLVGLFVSAGKGSETSQRQDLAAQLATSALESMRMYPYAALHLNGPVSNPLPDGRYLSAAQFQAISSPSTVDTIDSTTLPACTSSTTYSTTCSPFDPKDTLTYAGRTYTIYRVISYDKQSCALASLAPSAVSTLSSAIGTLYTNVSTAETLLNALNGSTSGSITAAVNNLLGLVTGLIGSSQLKNDLGTLSATLSASGSGLQKALSTVYADLTNLQSEGYASASGLSATAVTKLNALDLCSLIDTVGGTTKDLIPNVSGLTGLAGTLGTTSTGGSINAMLAAAVGDVGTTGVAGYTVLTPTTTVTNMDTTVNALNSSFSASVSASGSIGSTGASGAVGVTTSLGNLTNLLDCITSANPTCITTPHVKRISVAVVLASNRAGVGVQKAVWMSSAVADPADGLL